MGQYEHYENYLKKRIEKLDKSNDNLHYDREVTNTGRMGRAWKKMQSDNQSIMSSRGASNDALGEVSINNQTVWSEQVHNRMDNATEKDIVRNEKIDREQEQLEGNLAKLKDEQERIEKEKYGQKIGMGATILGGIAGAVIGGPAGITTGMALGSGIGETIGGAISEDYGKAMGGLESTALSFSRIASTQKEKRFMDIFKDKSVLTGISKLDETAMEKFKFFLQGTGGDTNLNSVQEFLNSLNN